VVTFTGKQDGHDESNGEKLKCYTCDKYPRFTQARKKKKNGRKEAGNPLQFLI
jgi:hypothetical protein